MDSIRTRHGWEVISSTLSDALETTQQRIRDNGLGKVADNVAAYAKAQPTNALIIAGAVGVVLGVLSGLRRR
jgi:ElaB/YqjD/DUF883 family membrane-anchored ribosome-binding protein